MGSLQWFVEVLPKEAGCSEQPPQEGGGCQHGPLPFLQTSFLLLSLPCPCLPGPSAANLFFPPVSFCSPPPQHSYGAVIKARTQAGRENGVALPRPASQDMRLDKPQHLSSPRTAHMNSQASLKAGPCGATTGLQGRSGSASADLPLTGGGSAS